MLLLYILMLTALVSALGLRLGGGGPHERLLPSVYFMVTFCNISSLRGGMRSTECHSSLCVYRATLCVSAVFAVVRCPSLCPSRSCIVSRRPKISAIFFLGHVAPLFKFLTPRAGTYGGAENAGVENAGVETAGAITYGKPSEEKTLRYQ